jgi:hypothetical protein
MRRKSAFAQTRNLHLLTRAKLAVLAYLQQSSAAKHVFQITCTTYGVELPASVWGLWGRAYRVNSCKKLPLQTQFGGIQKALQYLLRVVDDWFLSVSEKGSLISLPSRSREISCILHGSATTFILRSYQKDSYIVIIDCCFENAMFGEAIYGKDQDADEFILVWGSDCTFPVIF